MQVKLLSKNKPLLQVMHLSPSPLFLAHTLQRKLQRVHLLSGFPLFQYPSGQVDKQASLVGYIKKLSLHVTQLSFPYEVQV